MGTVADKLLQDALELGVTDRAALAAALLASLEDVPDEDSEAAWAAEIEHRAALARSGERPGMDWSEVRDRIREQLSQP